ncbi:MAG: ArsR/SmtB family transcription factor [Streptosporangiaceae bacterium]
MSFESSDELSGATSDEPARGEPTADEPVEISDPRALRALAHPARLTILEHLIIEGPATATECAEVARLSPSACSYHLRALARHGFVEEDPAGGADGRQRPWRARVVSMKVGFQPGRPDAVRAASRILVENVEALLDEVRASYRDHEAQYPQEWQIAAGTTQDVLHVTAAELEHVHEQIRAVLARYRRLGREQRPDGARRVYALVNLTPGFAPDSPA